MRDADGVLVETIITQAGIQLYVFDRDCQPLAIKQARGSATLRVEKFAKRYRYDLLPDGKGGLTAPVNLSKIAGRQIEVAVQLVGIGPQAGRISFNEVAAVPRHARPQVTVDSATQADAALIARQKNCPVMDEPLGSMGNPIKVMVGDKPIFLCCKGCVKEIRAEPTKYLEMVYGKTILAKTPALNAADTVPAGSEQVREGVFKVTDADAPYVAAQKRCPVMDEPLDAMGGPYKVNAAGKAVYICCPGCAKKIAAEPEKYLGILARQGVDAPLLR